MNSHIEMMKNDAHADEFLKQIFPDFRKHWLPDPENVKGDMQQASQSIGGGANDAFLMLES